MTDDDRAPRKTSVEHDEPHAGRRRRILDEHPEVKRLFGHEPASKYVCTALVVAQLVAATEFAHAERLSVGVFGLFVVGATLTQALFLAIHELSHNLFFKRPAANKLFAIFANLPLVVPFAISFRQYHAEHHKHQGVEGVDTDVPTDAEVRFFQGAPRKALWLMLQIVWYAVRPLALRRQPAGRWHALNVVCQLTFDALLVSRVGWRPLAFLLCSLIVAGGLHPCAGHFVAEHYTVYHPTQETTSYYGPLNWLTWNVGYHNEHHDFPNVPWSRLPRLHRLARAHYASLVACPSWTGILCDYVLRDDVGPHSRIVRRIAAKDGSRG